MIFFIIYFLSKYEVLGGDEIIILLTRSRNPLNGQLRTQQQWLPVLPDNGAHRVAGQQTRRIRSSHLRPQCDQKNGGEGFTTNT